MWKFVPNYRYRRHLMMCSASYHIYRLPWLIAPWTPRS